MHGLLDSIDRYVDRVGLTREVLAPVRPKAVPSATRRPGSTCAPSGSGRSSWPPGYRPDNAWVELPITQADGTFRQTRGVTDAPGVYVIGQRFQHRRDSGFIDGARHDAPRPRAPPDRRSGADGRRPAHRPAREEPSMNDYDVVIVGGRVAGASTALLLARAGLRVAVVERSRARLGHRVHPRVDAGRRPAALPVGPASRAGRGRDSRDPRTAFHYGDGDEARVTLRATPGVDALYAPRRHLLDRVLVDAAAASGADVLHETPVVGLLRDDDGRVVGVRLPAADGGEVPRSGPASPIGADGIGSLVAREVGAQVLSRGPSGQRDPLPLRRRGAVGRATSGATATERQPGSIPTNADETCVFVSTTPERMRPLRRDGDEAAFDGLLDAVPAATVRRRTRGWPVPAGCTAGEGCRGTSAGRSARDGPWSVTPATSRTRSPRTGSPTHCATRSCCRTRCSPGGGGASSVVALARYQDTRDRLSRALVEVTESVCRYDWDERPDPDAAASGELRDERRDGPPVRTIVAASTGSEVGLMARSPPDATVAPLVAFRTSREGSTGNRKGAAMGVQVRLLGGFGVVRDGVPVAADAWGRRQAAQLVQLLALARDRRMHREQVIDALWPGLSWESAGPRLHKAAHYARRALDDPDAVVLRHELVALFPGRDDVEVDVHEFTRTAHQASADRRRRRSPPRPCEWYAGPLLPEDPYQPWTDEPRRRPASSTSTSCGSWAGGTTCWPTSPPTRSAHLALARARVAAGDVRGALVQLERLEQALHRELGASPGAEAVRLRAELERSTRRSQGTAVARVVRGWRAAVRLFGRRDVGDRIRAVLEEAGAGRGVTRAGRGSGRGGQVGGPRPGRRAGPPAGLEGGARRRLVGGGPVALLAGARSAQRAVPSTSGVCWTALGDDYRTEIERALTGRELGLDR